MRAKLTAGSSRSEEGASFIEAAIIFPVLAMLVFGVIQMGFILTAYITLRNASAEGARAGVINIDTATSDRPAFDTIVTNAVIDSISPLDAARVERPVSINLSADTPPKVSVTVNYSLPLFPGSRLVLGSVGNYAMSGSTTMR